MKKAIIPEEMTALVASDSKAKSTSTVVQVRRVLTYLENTGAGINRYEAERELAVCHLAARIKNLKDLDHTFHTARERAVDHYGQSHKNIARYFLVSDQANNAEAV